MPKEIDLLILHNENMPIEKKLSIAQELLVSALTNGTETYAIRIMIQCFEKICQQENIIRQQLIRMEEMQGIAECVIESCGGTVVVGKDVFPVGNIDKMRVPNGDVVFFLKSPAELF